MSLLETAHSSIEKTLEAPHPALLADAQLHPSSILDDIDSVISKTPSVLCWGAGAASGWMATMPGTIGYYGKAISVGLGIGLIADMALKSSGYIKQPESTQDMLIREGGTLAAIVAGGMLGGLMAINKIPEAVPPNKIAEGTAIHGITRGTAKIIPIESGAGFRKLEQLSAGELAAMQQKAEGARLGGDQLLAEAANGGTRYDSVAATIRHDNAFVTPEARSTANALNSETRQGNLAFLNEPPPTRGATGMIQLSEIAKYPPPKQAEILQAIATMEKKGYPRQFLQLDPTNGTVIYNPDAHANAIELGEAE
ncbi:MAG TPA: hypothetical protein V6C81_30245 [Planktothrix sp.]|jgi:hypothetical protein